MMQAVGGPAIDGSIVPPKRTKAMPDSGELVLVTGISGFLGGHLALKLLAEGFRVRGSVRSAGKADKVRATLGRHGADPARLEVVTLDLMDDAGWDEAMVGVRYLQHTASPLAARMPEDRQALVRPAVDGTRRAVTAALGAGVERIVLTSSTAAVIYGHDATRTAPFTAADWTLLDGRGINAYMESKTGAERCAWELMEQAGRRGDLVAINPGGILGPLLDDDPGTSAALVGRLLGGSIPLAPRLWFLLCDVRDVAELHVRAMTAPAAGGGRFPFAAGTYSVMEIGRMLAAELPTRAGRMPRAVAPDWLVRLVGVFDRTIGDNLGELGVRKTLDASAAIALLGHKPIPAAEALRESALSLIREGLA
jgi:nucleoside-diphosphate-sugar epimerase